MEGEDEEEEAPAEVTEAAEEEYAGEAEADLLQATPDLLG